MSTHAFGAPGADGPVDRWYSHTAPGFHATALDKRIGNEIIYEVFLDRFANGNPDNDCLLESRFCDRSHNQWFSYWGGDLRGLIDKLPYLKSLGATRLWLTPIFENQAVTDTRDRFGRRTDITSYHGYWIRDWYRLNPFFTDNGSQDYAIVDELIAKAQPEMKMLLDTVTNHTSPAAPSQWSVDFLNRIEPLPSGDGVNRSHRGALFKDGTYVTSWDEDRSVGSQQDGGRKFHPYGWISDYNNQFQLENHQLDGLTDIDQNNPVMNSYMLDAHRFWLERFPGLAGYRMDTIKHVSADYWRSFDNTLANEFPNMEVVGEYYGGGPGNVGSQHFYRDTHMTMFDFEFRYALEAVFLRDESMSALSHLWERDPSLGDARSLATFIDNHDMARLRGLGMTFKEMRQALGLMFTARGIPTVYYGLEQDLFHPNDPGDPYNRPMMASFDQNGELFKLIAGLSAVRKQHNAVRWGRTHVVHESQHMLAYERVLDNDRVFFAMSKNPIAGSDDFEMTGLTFPDGEYTDTIAGKRYRVRGGKVPVSLRNGDFIVFTTPR